MLVRRVYRGLALAFAGASLLTGCATHKLLVIQGPAADTLKAGQCPQARPDTVTSDGPKLRDDMLPLVPYQMVLCRYAGRNHIPAGSLVGQVTVKGVDTLAPWRKRIEALPEPQAHPISCPMDDGSTMLAVFSDPADHVAVTIGTSGCATVTNGVRTATATSATDRTFLPDLERLIPTRP